MTERPILPFFVLPLLIGCNGRPQLEANLRGTAQSSEPYCAVCGKELEKGASLREGFCSDACREWSADRHARAAVERGAADLMKRRSDPGMSQYDVRALNNYLYMICEVCAHSTRRAEMREILSDEDGYFKQHGFVFDILRETDVADLEWADLKLLIPTQDNPHRHRIMEHFWKGARASNPRIEPDAAGDSEGREE